MLLFSSWLAPYFGWNVRVDAVCPNRCGGPARGRCGMHDRCTGVDIWESIAQENVQLREGVVRCAICENQAHAYAGVLAWESAIETGLCQCSPGFSGEGCRRLACPGIDGSGKQCSGHGQCRALSKSYKGWERDMVTACFCDPHYTGVDCSLRTCPSGDDPLTNKTEVSLAMSPELQMDEVQTLLIDGVHDLSGSFTLSYTDIYGREWETRPITVQNHAGRQGPHAYCFLLLRVIFRSHLHKSRFAYCPFELPACKRVVPLGRGTRVMCSKSSPSLRLSAFSALFQPPHASYLSRRALQVQPQPRPWSLSTGAISPAILGKGGIKQALLNLPNRVIPSCTSLKFIALSHERVHDHI